MQLGAVSWIFLASMVVIRVGMWGRIPSVLLFHRNRRILFGEPAWCTLSAVFFSGLILDGGITFLLFTFLFIFCSRTWFGASLTLCGCWSVLFPVQKFNFHVVTPTLLFLESLASNFSSFSTFIFYKNTKFFPKARVVRFAGFDVQGNCLSGLQDTHQGHFAKFTESYFNLFHIWLRVWVVCDDYRPRDVGIIDEGRCGNSTDLRLLLVQRQETGVFHACHHDPPVLRK